MLNIQHDVKSNKFKPAPDQTQPYKIIPSKVACPLFHAPTAKPTIEEELQGIAPMSQFERAMKELTVGSNACP